MNITGITADMIATSALASSSASNESLEQAESAALINTKDNLNANHKLQAKLDEELAKTQKSARRKKGFLAFKKNNSINKAKKREAKQEAELKKTKTAGDKLNKEADNVLAQIEKGNTVSQQLQKVMNQIQNQPTANADGGE